MQYTYTMRFFTRDFVNGECVDEHRIAEYQEQTCPIPIPTVGSTILLEDVGVGLYKVKEVEFCYPDPEDEIYNYEIDVIVEENR